ncbi:helix-turn-helix transcriptional regulator [Enterococcus entomosocium]|uniref:Helix-turn-helix transcriptional regulator n=1 Tax=Enterococcus entomosocium TaxID=3034352 RepID=A0ABV3MAC1_9ENTE|nr:XRE family transcriptional regulator [Enterococcus gallinarum]
MKLELEIANRIKEYRIAKKLTQEQLAEKIGFDVSYLGRIERGKSANIQISTLEKIIDALNEDYTTFFSFENANNKYVSIVHDLSLLENREEVLEIIEKIIKLEKKK